MTPRRWLACLTIAVALVPATVRLKADTTDARPAARVPAAAGAQAIRNEPVTVPLRFDRYYTYEQVGEALRALNKAYPDMTTLEVVGKSDEGRDIWGMTLNNPKTGAPQSKPGVYVDANIHGNEIQGTEVALYLLQTLLARYGENEQITKAVDRNVFYVIPSVNVDGRSHFLSDPNNPSGDRTLRVPRDDDRDGLTDEDGPDDLDGDGNITTMRKRDPFGQWKADPEDPRLLVRVKPGEPGDWTMLGGEGLDNDNDGLVNEDGPGYLDGNRNWGIHWEPPYVQSGAGQYPFSASGTRAIARWLVARPNIIMVFAFHNNGGMYLRGPSAKAYGPMNAQDVAVYDVLGENAEKIVPGYNYMVGWRDLYTTYGDFTDFTNNALAAYGFVGELFVTASETYRKPGEARPTGEGDEGMDIMGGNLAQDRERLLFNDNVVQGDLYTEWKPFTHPQYGDIEIGGWVKMSSRLPHPFMLPDLVHRNAAAVIFAASQTPDVTLEVIGAERIGQSLSRVRVRLVNKGVMPSLTFSAVQQKTHPLDQLKASGPGLTVVAGGVLTDIYRDTATYKAHKPEVQFLQVPGSAKVDYQFLVSGTGPLTVTYSSVKAGARTVTVDVR